MDPASASLAREAFPQQGPPSSSAVTFPTAVQCLHILIAQAEKLKLTKSSALNLGPT